MSPCVGPRIPRYPVVCCALLVWLSVVAVPASAAQPKTACELVTKANVESVFGLTLEEPISSSRQTTNGQDVFSACEFRGPGAFTTTGKRIIVSLSRTSVANPDPVNRSVRYRPDPSMSFKDVSDLGDAAYWAHARPGTNTARSSGFLRVFLSGTTELTITSFGFTDEAAELERAKKLAFIALGGSGKSGYVYAPPGKAPPTAAGSPQGSKGSATTEGQFLSDAETLRGLKAFSVAVASDDVKVEPIRNRVSQALRDHGITVLAEGAFPKIVIGISTTSMSVDSSTRSGLSVPVTVVAFSLAFEIVRPVPVGAKSMLVSTNINSFLGIGGPLVVSGQVQEAVDGVLKAFFRDYGAR